MLRPDLSCLANLVGLYADGAAANIRAIRTLAADRDLAGEPQTVGGRNARTPDRDALDRYADRGLYLFDGRESPEFES